MIGLPDRVKADLHRAAWKTMFDDFLARRGGQSPFTDRDYAEYVDGRPRFDGVREFLASRGIHLPEGNPDDPPSAETVQGLGNRKNDLVQTLIAEKGVAPYPGSLRYLEAVRAKGLPIAVVTSSANGAAVLASANLTQFVQVLIDGIVLAKEKLRGKPAPDSFLAGARALGVSPEQAAVFEDALAGVAAGRAGGFGHVVGVNRANQAEALREHGADVVVDDLAELLGDNE
jgi:beta-phosphoglucomutase family hydrolase